MEAVHKRMDHRRQKPRVTSPVQVPSVTCDLAAVNVEDLAGDEGDDSGNRMPSTTSLTRPRGPVAECVVAFRRVHRRLDHAGETALTQMPREAYSIRRCPLITGFAGPWIASHIGPLACRCTTVLSR